jgi:CRISPR/Cas system-associated endoribonuclease Cas2
VRDKVPSSDVGVRAAQLNRSAACAQRLGRRYNCEYKRKGLDSYTAQVVQNSRWIAELENINKVHSGYREDRWRELTHYVFWFHDSTFECIAESYEVEVFQESVSNLLAEACSRLLG